MFVCSCNVITATDIARAIDRLRMADPALILTPGLIYRTLGCRPKCGCCLPLVSRMIEEASESGDAAYEPEAEMARRA